MLVLDDAVLRDPARLTAVARARRTLPAAPLPTDAIARLAARLLHAPMAAVTLVDDVREHFAGGHQLPRELTATGHAPLSYSVCKYIVSQDRPVASDDLREHLLADRFGMRAFAGVPVRDRAKQPVGSLTVFETAPRHWTGAELDLLTEVAELLRPGTANTLLDGVAGLDTTALLDNVQEAFVAVDPDGVVVGFNHAAQRLLGYPATEVCGRHVDDSLLPGYDGRPIDAALGRLFAAAPHQPVVRDLTLRHRDGRRLAARASISVLPGAAGALACLFLTDLTDQAAAQQLAERHGSFLTALLDSLSVGVIACDDTGEVVVMNRALREVQGWSPDDPLPADLGASLAKVLYHADLRRMTWEETPLQRAFRGEHVTGADVVAAVPGHRVRTFASTAQPIIGADGTRLGAVSVAHEVTALRRAERFRDCHRRVDRALREAGSIAEAAPHVLRAVTDALRWPCAELFVIDETTGELRSVGHFDAGGAPADGFFGHVPLRGQGVTGRVWQTGQPIWVPDIAGYTDLRTPFERERAGVCLRRGIRTVLAVPVRDGGTLLGVLTCFAVAPEHSEDLLTVLLDGVAAQIGVYVALRRAEQLTRQLIRAQDDFIDLVGHEMRTPLTSIAANAGLLAEDAPGLGEEHQQMIDVINRNAAALHQIVDTLLDLAGLDSGRTALTRAEVDLAGVVRDAISAAGHRTGPVISTDLAGSLPVTGDPVRLRQVVDDLLANAAGYTPPGGSVHVRLRTRDDTAELCIADTGIGVPAGERDRVFDRFYRGSNVRHHGMPGSGLGLSLAHAIVRRHHGSIALTDNRPAGTVVCVRLPLSPG